MSNRHRHAPDQFDTPDEAASFYQAIDRHDDTLADQRTDAAHDTTTPTRGCDCNGPCNPYCWGDAFRAAYQAYHQIGEAS